MSGTLDVAFSVEEAVLTSHVGAAVVVIDVVRASTTIVTALAHGARGVVPVSTPEEARARAATFPKGAALLGGERGGLPPPGFERGNSPAEYTPERVAGRTVVFTTTNGTRALVAVARAARVAVAGFANAAAVVRWIGTAPCDVLLVCAGELGRLCLEDAACAGLLVTRLRAARPDLAPTDGALAAEVLYAHYAGDLGRLLRDAAWARVLSARGQAGDLRSCVVLDAFDVVPVTRDGVLVPASRD